MSARAKTVAAICLIAGLSLTPLAAILIVVTALLGAETAQACVPGQGITFVGGAGARAPIGARFTVTSEFGMRVNPTDGIYQLHAGVDLASAAAAPILAAAAGRVTFAGWAGGAGNLVVLDHGGATTTQYMHLSSLTVRVGQSVAAGQQIGIQGSTGDSTGAHLHFEVRQSGSPTNPRPWLQAHGIALPALKGWSEAPAPTGVPAGPNTPAAGEAAAVSTGVGCAPPGPLNHGEIPAPYRPWVVKAGAVCAEVPAALIAAQIHTESAWNPRAVNNDSGAQGPAQFLPGTFTEHGRDDDGNGLASPFDIADAVMAMARYDCHLAQQLRGRVSGDLIDHVLAAYNAGSATVLLHGGIPPYNETRAYVSSVRALAQGTYSQTSTAGTSLTQGPPTAPVSTAAGLTHQRSRPRARRRELR